jgi:peptidoglycan/LPS O-acetylase OafA/YrhL
VARHRLRHRPRQIGGATRFGDLSYGIYLYGWPIEQTVRYLLADAATWWLVFLISLPLAASAAMLSWVLVEKPALRLAGSRRFRRAGSTPARPHRSLPPDIS